MSHLANNYKLGDAYPPRLDHDIIRVYSEPTSPYAQRVLMVLTAKGIEHEIINLDIWHQPDWFIEKNPLGKVPVLEFGSDNRVLYESLICVDYIEETMTGDRTLQSPDPYQRAADRAFVDTMDQYFVCLQYLFTEPDLQAVWPNIQELLKNADKLLAKRRAGARYLSDCPLLGLTDYKLAPFIAMLPLCVNMRGYSWDEYFRKRLPELCDYRTVILKDPTVQKVVLPYENMLKITKMFRQNKFKN